jgi:CheY-like chemotaxis protein
MGDRTQSLKGKRLWIAEDNASLAGSLASFFEDYGALTKTFSDPYRLVDTLQATRQEEQPDIILTDWTFSPTPKRKGAYWDDKEADIDGGGRTVIEAVKNSGQRIPIIIFTGDIRLKKYASFPGADVSVLLKQSDIENVLDHIDARLSNTREHSPNPT